MVGRSQHQGSKHIAVQTGLCSLSVLENSHALKHRPAVVKTLYIGMGGRESNAVALNEIEIVRSHSLV